MPALRTLVVLLVVALLAVACGGDGGGGAKTAQPVTRQTDGLLPGSEPLRIGMIVPDYSALIPTGDVPRMTPDFYADRWRAEAAAADETGAMGPWSARFQVIGWDPVGGPEPVCGAIDASSADLFVAAVRLPSAIHDCLDADGRVALTLTHGAPGALSILPRTAPFARSAIAHLNFSQLLAGPVVIVTADDVVGARAGPALERALTDAGIGSSIVTLPATQGVQAVREAVPATLSAVRTAAPRTLLFAANTTIAAELGPDLVTGPWQTIGIDVDGLTDHWASARLPAAWRRIPTVASLAPTTVTESPFEGECRDAFEQFIAGETTRQPRADWPVSRGRGVASTRGAVDGSQSPPPDIGYHECTLTRTLAPALATLAVPYDTDELSRALRAHGPVLVARARRGELADDGALAHHTLLVELRAPNHEACATAGQQCWTTTTGDRSGMVPFG